MLLNTILGTPHAAKREHVSRIPANDESGYDTSVGRAAIGYGSDEGRSHNGGSQCGFPAWKSLTSERNEMSGQDIAVHEGFGADRGNRLVSGAPHRHSA